MNNFPWIILDCNNLLHRSFHAMKELSHGATFGFFRDFVNIQNKFMTPNIAFCFDHGLSLRKFKYSEYKNKKNNGERSDEEQEERNDFYAEIERIKMEILPSLGFNNIFFQEGYEADDMIASLCLNTFTSGEDVVIASGDKDLYQLLHEFTSIWDLYGKKIITEKSFYEKYKIEPEKWAKVKSAAGCVSDNIKGIPGVGEKTYIKHLKGELKNTTKAYKNIIENESLIMSNMELVELPFEGTLEFSIYNDKVTKKKWRDVMIELNMKSLCDKISPSAK